MTILSHVKTSDGVSLAYSETGSGPVLFMIPGWSQTAEQFKYQVEGLSDRYRVFTIDMRGHGESENATHGYRISRLAQDLREVLETLNLTDVTLLGHSMGCSVIWSYLDSFGTDRVSKLILVDQIAMVTSNPAWSAEELANSGAIFTPESLWGLCNGLYGPDAAAVSAGLVGSMFTAATSDEVKQWAIDLNMKMPRKEAADLLLNHCWQDWRDLIPRIILPTLIIGGEVSIFPVSGIEWVHCQIPGSRMEIFGKDEGGSHMMFIENPEKLNRLIKEFLG